MNLMRAITLYAQTIRNAGIFLRSQLPSARLPSLQAHFGLYALVLIYTLFFLPHAFILWEDPVLLMALEVDPGSIMKALHQLYDWPYYNMHNGYHSKFYGWAYLSLNFWLLFPVKLYTLIFAGGDPMLFHAGVRALLFVLGLGSVMLFYALVRIFTHSHLLAFIGGLLLVISGFSSMFYVFVHPETTGLIFMLLGVVCLLKFIDDEPSRHQWYVLGLAALVLGSLCKQAFFITALPVLLLFLYFHLHFTRQRLLAFIAGPDFFRIFIFTCLLSGMILFLVHPYSLFEPHNFLGSQLSTFFDHAVAKNTVPVKEGFIIWWRMILTDAPVILLSFILAPFSVWICLRDRGISHAARVLYLTNLSSCLVITLVVTLMARLFPGLISYLYPVYPFFLFNLLCIFAYLMRHPMRGVSPCLLVVIAYILTFNYLVDARDINAYLKVRMNYQNTATYKVMDYIRAEIAAPARIAHDHFIAVPAREGYSGCHYWNSCSLPANLEAFAPDYIILNESYTHNYAVPAQTQMLLDYVTAHDFEKTNHIDGQVIGGAPVRIGIWKRGEE